MNWIKDPEEEKIMAWVEEGCSKGYLAAGWKEEASSYFHKFDNCHNAEDFAFDSIVELKKHLENMWGQDPVMKEMAAVCAVAAFRNKPEIAAQEDTLKRQVQQSSDFIMPDYVYVF